MSDKTKTKWGLRWKLRKAKRRDLSPSGQSSDIDPPQGQGVGKRVAKAPKEKRVQEVTGVKQNKQGHDPVFGARHQLLNEVKRTGFSFSEILAFMGNAVAPEDVTPEALDAFGAGHRNIDPKSLQDILSAYRQQSDAADHYAILRREQERTQFTGPQIMALLGADVPEGVQADAIDRLIAENPGNILFPAVPRSHWDQIIQAMQGQDDDAGLLIGWSSYQEPAAYPSPELTMEHIWKGAVPDEDPTMRPSTSETQPPSRAEEERLVRGEVNRSIWGGSKSQSQLILVTIIGEPDDDQIIPYTPAMYAEFCAERARTDLGPHRILSVMRPQPPKGLNTSFVSTLSVKGKRETIQKGRWRALQAAYRQQPDASVRTQTSEDISKRNIRERPKSDDYVSITEDRLKELRVEYKRTGMTVGRLFVSMGNACPQGLSGRTATYLQRGRLKTIRTEYWNAIMETLRRQPSEADVGPSRIYNDPMFQQLRAEQNRTGADAAALLAFMGDAAPRQLTRELLEGYLHGDIRQYIYEGVWQSIIAAYQAMPSLEAKPDSHRDMIDFGRGNQIMLHREMRRLAIATAAELLQQMGDSTPAGLKAETVDGLIDGTATKVDRTLWKAIGGFFAGRQNAAKGASPQTPPRKIKQFRPRKDA